MVYYDNYYLHYENDIGTYLNVLACLIKMECGHENKLVWVKGGGGNGGPDIERGANLLNLIPVCILWWHKACVTEGRGEWKSISRGWEELKNVIFLMHHWWVHVWHCRKLRSGLGRAQNQAWLWGEERERDNKTSRKRVWLKWWWLIKCCSPIM